MRKTCIVLVGAPCSGKSAVGIMTASSPSLNIAYVSSGDIARQMATVNRQIKEDLANGKMAPEDMMRRSISDRLWQHFHRDDKDIVILDGFPRFGDQATWLRSEIPSNIDIKYVLFDVRIPTIIERSAHRGRDDDKSLVQRLKYYYNTTFRELRKYIDIEIDANDNTIKECSALLTKFIEEVSKYC